MVRALIVFMAAAAITGCTTTMGIGEKSEFACNKKQDGMGCSSVESVYEATNGANYRQAISEHAVRSTSSAPTQSVSQAAVAPMPAPSWPAPVLEPASVLRIWIAPWVDDKKALHWPSYVFAEVTPRKWSFGNMDFRSSQQLVPLQVDGPRKGAESGSTVQPLQPPR